MVSYMVQKKKGFVSGKERHTTILDKAPVMNGKQEWLCSVVQTSNDWTRKKCDAQEEVQGDAQKVVDIEKEMQDLQEKSCVWKTPTKNEEQLTRVVCSKATRTHRVVEVFEGLWNRRAKFPPGTFRAEVRHLQGWCARLSAEVEEEEDKPEAGGQHTEPSGKASACIEFWMKSNACVLGN